MSTKNNPGRYDCYTKADPDEPMFVLLGRDPAAAITVRFWMIARTVLGFKDTFLHSEANQCASDLENWASKSEIKVPKVYEASLFFETVKKMIFKDGTLFK